MKEFNLKKIGKKMPYDGPSAEFFENFKSDMIERVSTPELKDSTREGRGYVMRLFIPLLSSAAALAIGLFIAINVEYKSDANDMDYLISDNLDASLDSFFDNLSDDELALLVKNSSSQDDFYYTLQTNE